MEFNDYYVTSFFTVLIEKLVVAQLIMIFHSLYAARKFITVFTKARYYTLLKAA
jgi:hypothetical protein